MPKKFPIDPTLTMRGRVPILLPDYSRYPLLTDNEVVEMTKHANYRSHGLTRDEYLQQLEAQQRRCAYCGMGFQLDVKGLQGPAVCEHYHADGWDKMTPQERRKHFRALTCSSCNMALAKVEAVTTNAFDAATLMQLRTLQHLLTRPFSDEPLPDEVLGK
jgi:hypothetical protein